MATTQNLGCQKINTQLATAFPEFYNMEFQNGYLVAMVTTDLINIYLHFKFASLSVTIPTAIISITLHFVHQIVKRLLKSIPNTCIFYMFPWKCFIVHNDTKMPFAIKSPFTTGTATLEPSLFWRYLHKYVE